MTQPEIRLRDLSLAAFLLSHGINFARTEYISARQAEFVFHPETRDETDRAEQLRRSWVNQTGTCNAVRFAGCIKTLKGEVHAIERDGGPTVEHRRG